VSNQNELPLDWDAAKAHFDAVYKTYADLLNTPGANTMLAIWVVFWPLSKRYEAGERTPELYAEMMGMQT